MNKPKLSVIIPVFNSEKTISQCVDACLKISGYPLEIILIDDGSTDNSLEICNRYHNSYDNVTVYHQTNAGVSSARNKGIELSSGEILYFLDSDDIPCVVSLMTSLQKMEDSKADIILGGYAVTDIDGTVMQNCANLFSGFSEPEQTCIQFIRNQIQVCVGSFLVKKKCVSNIHFLNGIRYGEDTTYIAECIVQCTTIYVYDAILVLYRQNGMSVMHKLNLSRFDNCFARLELKNFILSNHCEMTDLIAAIDYCYIPEVLEDDIRLLCHYGFSLFRIRNYISKKKLDEVIHSILQRGNINPVLYSRLSLWKNWPVKYYVSERQKRLLYVIRSTLGKIKRHL